MTRETFPTARRSRLVRVAWLSLLVWVVVALLLTMSFALQSGTTRDDGGADGDGVKTTALTTGDCLKDRIDVGTLSDTVVLEDCAKPHMLEVYAEFDLPAGEFPGGNKVTELGEAGCVTRYAKFVGRAFDDSNLEMFYFLPSEAEWKKDRSVSCMIGDDKAVTGTLQNAKR